MSDAKRAVRSELIRARARITPEERAAKSREIADRLEQVPAFREAQTLAVYAPLGTEVDTTEIARRAVSRGVRVVFPRAVSGERSLAFARTDPAALVRGPLGASEPPPDAPAVALDEIDCVVVPGVAFSEDGVRLGRGGGHYDATLERMPRAARVGITFEALIVPTLPREPHDAPVDAIVSEARILVRARESR
jgi:5-formyltetrahydrofolate cyclo-ligase